jgi:hypothetical protein
MKFTQAVLKKNWLLRKIPRSKYWRVEEEFVWFLDYESKKEWVEIHKWFKTDFGSIPKILQNIFNPTKYLAYILHDFLYSKEWVIRSKNWNIINYTRKEADLILLEALRVEWASIFERLFVYLGVRLGGFLFFKK